MSLRGRGVCKTKDKRGNIFKKKWRTRQLEARRPVEDQKKQGGKIRKGRTLELRFQEEQVLEKRLKSAGERER